MNSDLKKQAQGLELAFLRKTKSYPPTDLFQQYINNLSE